MKTLTTLTFVAIAAFTTTSSFAAPKPTAPKTAPKAAPKAAAKAQRVDVEVTKQGFVAAQHTVKAGQPVTLVVTRKVEKTCATDIMLKEYGITKPLPLNTPVEVTFTPAAKGEVKFTCAMGMVSGSLVAE